MTRKTKSWKQLLVYMMQDKTRSDAFILKQHIEGNSVKTWTQAFAQNEANRAYQRSNSVTLYHEILSWSNKDIQKMTDAKMKDMAQKYLELRNENALAIAIPHFNKTHYHIHFCLSGVEIDTGKALRISKEDFNKVKERLQQYQLERYPELSNSIVEHGRKRKRKEKEREFQLTKRTKAPSEKERTKKIVEQCYKKALSRADFFDIVAKAGLQTYARNGKLTGVEGDRKIRFSTLGVDETKLRDLDDRESLLNEIQTTRGEERLDIEREANDILFEEALEPEGPKPEAEVVEEINQENNAKTISEAPDYEMDL